MSDFAAVAVAPLLGAWITWLPTFNAGMNSLATILLIVGLQLIKRRQETAHRNVMLAAFGASVIFLVTYLLYHYLLGGGVKYQGGQPWRTIYFFILGSHVILAMAVPVLALLAIYNGLKDRREQHRKIVKWAYPIWLYVSITGVVIYFMLYHFNAPPA
ncbi:MAG TPA: DUF420 domain-containing protein [Pirellulales bacterium]